MFDPERTQLEQFIAVPKHSIHLLSHDEQLSPFKNVPLGHEE